jgi:hypothetical protein
VMTFNGLIKCREVARAKLKCAMIFGASRARVNLAQQQRTGEQIQYQQSSQREIMRMSASGVN